MPDAGSLRGIDGTEVLTHFPPEDTYNCSLRPELLQKGVENFQERGFIDGFLSLFGIGDGGGGPHEEHIEFGLRHADLEGSPRVAFGPARDYLDRLPAYHADLPVWSGELYLELHRGTLIESPVLAEAACLNVPALVFEGRRGMFTAPCRLEGSGVSLEVIKRAEKARTVVIRLVETDGRQSTCRIVPADPKTVLVETNLVEWTEEERFAPGPDGAVELALTPYSIRTFKLQH